MRGTELHGCFESGMYFDSIRDDLVIKARRKGFMALAIHGTDVAKSPVKPGSKDAVSIKLVSPSPSPTALFGIDVYNEDSKEALSVTFFKRSRS